MDWYGYTFEIGEEDDGGDWSDYHSGGKHIAVATALSLHIRKVILNYMDHNDDDNSSSSLEK
eukprot:9174162-Ditylum_brightwellii.AAC.1